jgi:hypothetical protein
MNFNVAVNREGWEKKKTTWYRAAKFGNDISILPFFKKGTKVFYLENLILDNTPTMGEAKSEPENNCV